MAGKKFKAAFVAMAPDSDPSRHRSEIETSMYHLTSILVKDEEEAVRVCQELVAREGVQSFILCPGFTNTGVARVAEAVGKDISVNVARGDHPSNASAHRNMREAGFFS